MRVISFFNLKGGVGKTSSSLALAGIMNRKYNRHVLLVDLDPQGNSTQGSGVNKDTLNLTAYHAITGQCNPSEAVVKCARWDLLPSNIESVRLGLELRDYTTLSNRLNRLFQLYDIVILDCPPAISTVTMSALVASTHLVIPVEPESFSEASLSDMQFAIDGIRQYNQTLNVTGVLLIRFDKRTNLARQTQESMSKAAQDLLDTRVFNTTIRQSTVVASAIRRGVPLIDSGRSPVLIDYLNFATELIHRL